MPQTSDRRNWLHVLLALAVTMTAVVGFASPADSAPPVDELIWSGGNCTSGFPTATLTALGNGRWATVMVEVSTDGGDTFIVPSDRYSPLRFEHGTGETVGWDGDTVIFRASDAKNNGSLMGEWVASNPVSCP